MSPKSKVGDNRVSDLMNLDRTFRRPTAKRPKHRKKWSPSKERKEILDNTFMIGVYDNQ